MIRSYTYFTQCSRTSIQVLRCVSNLSFCANSVAFFKWFLLHSQQTSLQRSDRPMYDSPVPQDGASRWSLPLSSSERYREDHWEEPYSSASRLEATPQPSVYTKAHYAGRPQPVTPRFNRVAPRACTQNIEEDEIAARIQNIHLRAGPNQSDNFTTGERRHSRSTLPPRGAPPPKQVSRSVYNSPSHPSDSRASSAAPHNSMAMVYRSKSQTPHNATTRPKSATSSFPSTRNHYPSRTWSMDEAKASDSFSWSSDESWSDDFTAYSDNDFY